MICFYANTRYAEARTNDAVTTGSVGIPVQFHFSEEWDGTQKIAIFKCGEAAVDVALTGLAGDQTVVPAECMADPSEWLTIGVYGARPDGTVVIPTIWVDVAITKTGAAPSGVDPSEPTPSWVAQVQEMASDALAHMENMTAQAATLPAGSSATASWDPDTDVLSLGIPKGDQGVPGQDGADGRDATITVGSTTTGAAGTNASVTNTGTPSAAVLNFTIPRGNTGAPGQDGADGVSPEVSIASITGGHSVTITDADHPAGQTFNVMDGADGADGVSPEVTIATITGGHSVTITDADHPTGQTFNVMDGVDGAVTSVNGQTGDVVLDADDVGAATMQDIIDQLPVDSASGAIASFPDGAGGIPVEALTVQINPVQDLHGYSNPWPAGGGSNIWDEEWEEGYINTTTGQPSPATGRIRSKNFCACVPNQTYYGNIGTAGVVVYLWWYDSNKDFISPVVPFTGRTQTAPANAYYFKIATYPNPTEYGTYKNDIMVNYPSTVTTYSPYANICPISGHQQAKVTDDPAYGGFIEWNQLAEVYEGSRSGITVSDAGNGIAEISNTVTSTYFAAYKTLYVTQGHKIFFKVETIANPNNVPFYFGAYNLTNEFVVNADTEKVVTVGSTKGTSVGFSNLTANTDMTGIKLRFQWYDLTEMFGAGNEPTTVDEFRALFPNDYYAYNAGTPTCVSAVNGDPYRQITIDLSGTRYGGTLDIKTGVLTVTHQYVNLGALEWSINAPSRFQAPLPAYSQTTGSYNVAVPCICSHYATKTQNQVWASNIGISIQPMVGGYVYVYDSAYTTKEAFATAMNGVQLVYPLATPLTVQLDANTLATLLGINNVWTSTNGDTSVTYRANIQKYIQKLLGA